MIIDSFHAYAFCRKQLPWKEFLCMKRGLCTALAVMLLTGAAWAAPLESGVPVELTSPSAMLVEAETGAVIFEKNADERRQVASITKLMTLLLCFEALENGDIHLEDQVVISPEAAGQIGSQALLDSGAAYPLEALFAQKMNERARQLGMNNTCYVNATGLPQEGQYTTARDVATLSREVCRHQDYFNHASVWMDTLTHPSGRTTDLTNTNRLVRFYPGCDGLKTGSADVSKYCLSATAQKDGLRLIAIVLGTPNSQTRFNEARSMLDYGFAAYRRVTVLKRGDRLGKTVRVKLGMQEEVDIAAGRGMSMLIRPGQEKTLCIETELPDEVQAPVKEGDALGIIRIRLGDSVIARLPAVAACDVDMPGLLAAFVKLLKNWR